MFVIIALDSTQKWRENMYDPHQPKQPTTFKTSDASSCVAPDCACAWSVCGRWDTQTAARRHTRSECVGWVNAADCRRCHSAGTCSPVVPRSSTSPALPTLSRALTLRSARSPRADEGRASGTGSSGQLPTNFVDLALKQKAEEDSGLGQTLTWLSPEDDAEFPRWLLIGYLSKVGDLEEIGRWCFSDIWIEYISRVFQSISVMKNYSIISMSNWKIFLLNWTVGGAGLPSLCTKWIRIWPHQICCWYNFASDSLQIYEGHYTIRVINICQVWF